jgi:Flp pilus assembly protein TadG
MRMRLPCPSLLSLARDRRGVTIVEFALVAPVVLFLICGSMEIGHMMFARMMLDGAVVEASRQATASLETGETQRTQIMRDAIIKAMAPFPLATGQTIQITTTVYKDFNSASPETYTDSNGNGRYDLGEPYVDRNQNGQWDDAVAISGSTLGGPGDVVGYTARFPKRILFTPIARIMGFTTSIPLSATTVVRNEAVVQKASS